MENSPTGNYQVPTPDPAAGEELPHPKDPHGPPAVKEEVEVHDPQTGQVTSEIKRISTPDETIVEETTRDAGVPEGGVVTTKRVIRPSPKAVKEYSQKKSVYRLKNWVRYAHITLQIILGFRLFLKVTGADPDIWFSRFIYGASHFFVVGFNNLFGRYSSEAELHAHVEWSTLVAMIFYWLVAGRLTSLFSMQKPVKPSEVEQAVSDPKKKKR